MNGMEELSLLRVDDQLAIDRQPLARTLYTERLALLLKRRGVGHLKFINGIEFDELMALSAGLVSSEREIQSSRHLRLGQVEVRHSLETVPDFSLQAAQIAGVFGVISQEELARVIEIYEAVRRGRRLQVVGLSEIIAKFIDVFARACRPASGSGAAARHGRVYLYPLIERLSAQPCPSNCLGDQGRTVSTM